MLSIAGGVLKGRRITAPLPAIRPTTSLVRTALFNLLQHHPAFPVRITGMPVLDLCTGTGILAFESISWGASAVHCVDKDSKILSHLHLNAKALGISDKVSSTLSTLPHLPPATCAYPLIFYDPPYKASAALWAATAHALLTKGWITFPHLVIIETHKVNDFVRDDTYTVIDTRLYGGTKVVFLTLHPSLAVF